MLNEQSTDVTILRTLDVRQYSDDNNVLRTDAE